MGKRIFHILLIIAVGSLAYSNTFNVPFHFDDIGNIVGNYKFQSIQNFWPPSGSRWFGYLTFALNYHFGGLNTTSYHIVNLVIHIFNAIFVYWLVILTFKTPYFSTSNPPSPPFRKGGMGGFALFSALLFVSHPIQTQAVTYIVQRFTSLATMFYLLSLACYIRSRLSTLPATRYTLYAVSFFSAILAMKTKEIAFTLPIIIALYEFMFFDGKIKKRILYLLPLLLTMLIIPLSIVGIDKPIGDAIGEIREAAQETEEIPRWSYLFTQFRVIITYIRLLVLPINQNLDYDYPLYHSFFNPEVFLSLLFLLLIFAFGIYLLYAKRYTLHASRFLAFGIFWFFITLSVESSIIPIKDVIFEHRLYLPSVGAFIAITTFVFSIPKELKNKWEGMNKFVILASAGIIIVLSIATYQRNIVWQNELSLWEDVVKKSPDKARGHNELGIAYASKGLFDNAIEHFHATLRLEPGDADAHNNLGIVYHKKGLIDKAIEYYRTAMRLEPDYALAYNNLGKAYWSKGRFDEAIEHYRIALRLVPDFTEAHYNLGVAYERKGLIDEAIKEYQKVLRLNPGHEIAENSLNRIFQIQRSK